jgi:hypothetical protein
MRTRGYYTPVQVSPGLLLFTRLPVQRTIPAVGLAISGVVVLGVASLLLLRAVQDIPGICFTSLIGISLLAAALLTLDWWTEIEFNTGTQTVLKRRHFFGKAQIVDTLPFNQIKSVQLHCDRGEYDVTHVRLINPNGKVWASLPGYFIENHARVVQRMIQELIGS